ncbi:MAG: hypothetical protein CL489_08350 [Acidobacteria bacterium]|nr:hypothetical protein [Acidobacteriota bacterium]|tara:strand:- start:63042 stop:63482 length:441 start_codon:yes stop_codon:yes gene_type:complete
MNHKINKDSWHYNLIMRYLTTPPKSLCVYPYTVIFFMLLSIVLVLVAITVILLVGYAVIAPTLVMLGFMDISWKTNAAAIITSLVSVYIGCIMFYLYCRDRYRIYKNKKFFSDEPPKPKPKPKQSNMIVAIIKAKKEKICPRIEYV